MTELWLSWAKRSQQHQPRPVGGRAVEDAGVADSSAEANGNAGGEGVGVEASAAG